jgi:branched-chain amino acid transport system permease protein
LPSVLPSPVDGVLLAASRTFISPESFNFMQSIGVLAMVILGGIGSIPGVILGAAVITTLNLQVSARILPLPQRPSSE